MRSHHRTAALLNMVLSCVICSIAVNWIALPNGFVVTGITGLAMTAETFTGINYALIYYGLTLAILYEVFLGSVAFFMVPERQWKRLGGLLAPAPTAPPDGRAQGYVQKKLEATAAAFRTLYESLRGSFRVPENDNDVAAVFDRAACRVCRTCSLRSSCWERDYVTTFNALNDATAPMLERGRGVASDYPRYFADRCLHFPAFVEAVNQELTALLYRRQYNSRIRESRAAVCRQYGELSALLGTAAAELSRELIPDPAGNQKLRRHLALLGLEMETAVYRDEYGRLRAELKGEGCQTLDTPEELAALSDLLGVPTRAEAGEEPAMTPAQLWAGRQSRDPLRGDYLRGLLEKLDRALDGLSRARDGRAEDRRRELAALRQELLEMREEWEAWQR